MCTQLGDMVVLQSSHVKYARLSWHTEDSRTKINHSQPAIRYEALQRFEIAEIAKMNCKEKKKSKSKKKRKTKVKRTDGRFDFEEFKR